MAIHLTKDFEARHVEAEHDARALWERLLWTALVGIASGAAAIAAARLAEWSWTRLRHEPPPDAIGLLKAVAQKAGETGVHRLI